MAAPRRPFRCVLAAAPLAVLALGLAGCVSRVEQDAAPTTTAPPAACGRVDALARALRGLAEPDQGADDVDAALAALGEGTPTAVADAAARARRAVADLAAEAARPQTAPGSATGSPTTTTAPTFATDPSARLADALEALDAWAGPRCGGRSLIPGDNPAGGRPTAP